MKIGIIGAMAQEVEILSQLMMEPKVTEIAGRIITIGYWEGCCGDWDNIIIRND